MNDNAMFSYQCKHCGAYFYGRRTITRHVDNEHGVYKMHTHHYTRLIHNMAVFLLAPL